MKFTPFAAAVLSALPCIAFADADLDLNPVIVTANRVVRSADETLASVSVMTRQDIERSQAYSIEDLLRGLPGVEFSNAGGPGKATSLYLRGTNDGHTLVLVDGVKVGSATLGNAGLQDIPLDQIERIELVRGPRASLYGSEAIGGVLQIFTRHGVQSPSLALTAGSRSTYQGAGNIGFGNDKAWASVGASANTTRGFNACKGTRGYKGCATDEPDRDGYNNNAFNLRAGAALAKDLSADVQYLQYEGNNKYDGASTNETRTNERITSGTLRYAPSTLWHSSLSASRQLHAERNSKDDLFVSRFGTNRDAATWQNEFQFSQTQQLVAGIDYLRDRVSGSDTDYSDVSRINRAGFLQYLTKLGAFDGEAALRRDQNSQFGGHNTGSVAAGYTFSPALHLRASYGSAFKAPTFNDLYWPSDAYTSGNPALKPELSRTTELGLSGRLGQGFQWQTSVFKTRVSNLIAWAMDPVTYGWAPSNVAQAHITGLELSATQRWQQTRLAANVTLLNPKDHSGSATEGNLLARRTRQTARLDADHQIGAWGLGATLNASGMRYDDAANTTKLGGYATVDLRTEYRVNADWRVQTRIENLFNKHYETQSLYNQAGIGAFVTVRYQPK